MAIEGSLADVNLADICQLVSMGRKTGCFSRYSRLGYSGAASPRFRVSFTTCL